MQGAIVQGGVERGRVERGGVMWAMLRCVLPRHQQGLSCKGGMKLPACPALASAEHAGQAESGQGQAAPPRSRVCSHVALASKPSCAPPLLPQGRFLLTLALPAPPLPDPLGLPIGG